MKSLQKGYTLLELLVVTALLTGLSTVLLLNSGVSEDVMRLDNAAVQLESLITLAQSYGNSGKAFPEGASSPEAFDKGYGIYLQRNSGTVVMYGGHGDTITVDGDITYQEEKYAGSSQDHQTVTLEGGTEVTNIVFTPSPSNNQEAHIFFRRGKNEAGIHSLPAAANHNDKNSVRITLTKAGITKDIVVNKTGLIYID